MFEYKLRERDDSLDSGDTMDLCRDTETENEALNQGNSKPEFSRFMSQVNSQLLNEHKPPRPNDSRPTLKPQNITSNILRSPVFQNVSQETSNNISCTIQSQSSNKTQKRRSKSKVTRIQSRKKFKEDELLENVNPNTSQSTANLEVYREQVLSEDALLRNYEHPQYGMSVRKIEFHTIETQQVPSLQNQNKTLAQKDTNVTRMMQKNYDDYILSESQNEHGYSHEFRNEPQRIEEYRDFKTSDYHYPENNFRDSKKSVAARNQENDESFTEMNKLPSSQYLFDKFEEIERIRFVNPPKNTQDTKIEGTSNEYSSNTANQLLSNYKSSSGIYHNTTETSKASQNMSGSASKPFQIETSYQYTSNVQSYEERKALALKELDDIIATSEDEVYNFNAYLCKYNVVYR